MKKTSLLLMALATSTAHAKVTLEDANRDHAAVADANPGVSQKVINDHWSNTGRAPNETTGANKSGAGTLTSNGSFTATSGATGRLNLSLHSNLQVHWGSCRHYLTVRTPKGTFTTPSAYAYELNSRRNSANVVYGKVLTGLSANTNYGITVTSHTGDQPGKACGQSTLMAIQYSWTGN